MANKTLTVCNSIRYCFDLKLKYPYFASLMLSPLPKMSTLFFSPLGRNLFYVCLVIYLYGDLAIYGAAVAKSLRGRLTSRQRI
jgi:hypothetical protein